MHCGGCATGLEMALNAKGIKAKVDFDAKEAVIEFYPKKISLEEIKKEIGITTVIAPIARDPIHRPTYILSTMA